MSGAARVVALLVGALAIGLLMRALPDDVLAATQAALYVAAALILLLVAASVFVRPARALSARLFLLPVRADGPLLGMPRPEEMRATFRPLLVAGICLAVVLVSGLLRA